MQKRNGGSYIRTRQIKFYSTSSNADSGLGPGPGPDTGTNNSQDGEYEENIRNKILKASLPFVQIHGWTRMALSQGAETLGYPGVSHGMFPNGGADLVSYFYLTCNSELVEHMKKATSDQSVKIVPQVFIEDAIQRRLRMIVPYLEKWPQALGIMTLPPNVPVALANLLTLVDDICHYAGDNSVDFHWYTRRIAIGGIYKMTELCMVQDKSDDFEETWRFLHRRMEEAIQIQQVLLGSEEVTAVAKDAVTATFTTARNILRLNRTGSHR